jgi:hypothetical protein
MRTIFFIIALTVATSGFSQNRAVKSGEKFVYAASYNMSGLMTQLAQVTMETETVKTSKNTLLHLSCEATTYSKWDSYFKIPEYASPKPIQARHPRRQIHQKRKIHFQE